MRFSDDNKAPIGLEARKCTIETFADDYVKNDIKEYYNMTQSLTKEEQGTICKFLKEATGGVFPGGDYY